MKTSIITLLVFIFSMLIAAVGGTAYTHNKFATKSEVTTVKDDINKRLDRLEYKIDGDWQGPTLKEMRGE